MYSSLIFITNVGHSIYKKSYMYTSTFSFLLVSSVMWHGTRLTVWFWMRKYLSDVYNDFNILLFIVCIELYAIEKVFFQNNIVLDTICHMLIHFIGCIGQHIILYGLDFDIPKLIELNATKKSETTKGSDSS